MALNPREQWNLLKTPLLITGAILALLLAAALILHFVHPPTQPAVVESPAPAVALRNLAFFKEGDEYVLYFSLVDTAGNEIARRGGATIRISQLGTIGVEGGPQFVNETVLLDGKFEVGLGSYRWIEIGGAIFFTQRQLVIPKRIPTNLFKLPPRSGQLGKISVRFRDASAPDSALSVERRLLFP